MWNLVNSAGTPRLNVFEYGNINKNVRVVVQIRKSFKFVPSVQTVTNNQLRGRVSSSIASKLF